MTVQVPSLDEALPLAAIDLGRERDSKDDRVARCRDDIREFAKHVWLSDPVLGEIPFAMWDWQPGLLELWAEQRLICVLKARQLGVSWLVAVYVLWIAMFRPAQRVLLISIGQRDADKLLDKVKFVLRKLPDWLRPSAGLTTMNTRLIRFSHLDSEIESLPSTGGVGRSRTASLVVLDEHAWQAQDGEIWTAVKPTVEHGQLISISTANGLGPLHTRLYKGAVEGEGGFVPVFIPWSAHPERDEAWYDTERESFRIADQPDQFLQEYPSNDIEAFIVSGSAVWTIAEITRQPVEEIEPTEPGLWVYREPEKGMLYVIGADPAEGIVGGDWCSASVLRLWRDEDGYHGDQVAQLRGLWPPEVFAKRLHALASWYGKVGYEPRKPKSCWLGVERNNHGHAVLLKLRDLNPKDNPYGLSAWKGSLGWLSTPQSRPVLYDEFAAAIRGEQIDIHDPVTVSQMSTFAQTAKGGEAQKGFHDDDISAAAIGWQHYRRAFGVLLDVPPSAR